MSLSTHLATLESSGLIRLAAVQPEIEYLFRHALVQEAAYTSLVKADRRRLHLAVGEALERAYPDRLGELARHFDEAGDEARALKYFTLAGDHAAGQYANAEAMAHYARALELAKRASPMNHDQLLHLYTRRGRVMELSGRHEAALANYAEMGTLAGERGERRLVLAALLARATLHSTPTPAHNPALAQTLLDQALTLARELGDRQAEARSLWNLMLVRNFTGEIHRGIKYGEESLVLARELGLREQLAYTLNDLGNSYMLAGRLGRSLAALQESRELWQALGNLPMLADSLSTSALVYFYLGRLDQAIAQAEGGLRVSRSIRNLWGQSYGWAMLGYPCQELGQMDKAIEAWEESVQLGKQGGLVAARVGIRADLAWAYGTLGAIEPALQLASLALATADEVLLVWRPWAHAVLARLHLLNGNLAEAQAAVEQIGQGTIRDHFFRLLRSGAVAVAMARAELALARQDYARVLALMDDLSDHLRSTGAGAFLSDALHLKGQVLLAQGQMDEACETLRAAQAAAEAIGSRRALWPALLALSQVESQRGDHVAAGRLRQQAREIVSYIADHTGAPELRASFVNLPLVQLALTNYQSPITNHQSPITNHQ